MTIAAGVCLPVPLCACRARSGIAEGGDLSSHFLWEWGMCQLPSQSCVPPGALSADAAGRCVCHRMGMAAGCRQAPRASAPWRDVSVFSVMGSFPARQERGPPRVSFAGLLPCLRAICGAHRHENNLSKGDDCCYQRRVGFICLLRELS